MKKLTAIILILLIFLLSQVMGQELFDIKAIDVLDNNYDTIKSIQDDKDLISIELIWDNLVLIDAPPNNDWEYKLDIQSSKIGGRWLYNTEGYISKLSYQLRPSYKVPDPAELRKKLLGL